MIWYRDMAYNHSFTNNLRNCNMAAKCVIHRQPILVEWNPWQPFRSLAGAKGKPCFFRPSRRNLFYWNIGLASSTFTFVLRFLQVFWNVLIIFCTSPCKWQCLIIHISKFYSLYEFVNFLRKFVSFLWN